MFIEGLINMSTKVVHFLTGIRSEYDIIAPVMEEVSKMPGLSPSVIVTGAHLCEDYGLSIRQVEADGFRIAGRIDSLLRSDGLGGRVKGVGLQVIGLTDLFDRERPDFLVVMGDREESITGALVAAYHHIPVVHLGGGDHADDGNVDNSVRHAVTKLAHLHMAASPRSAERIIRMGEAPWRVHTVGASGLDRLVSTPHMPRQSVMDALGADWRDLPYGILIYHPTISDYQSARHNILAILDAVKQSGIPFLIIYPNSDPGNGAVINELSKFAAENKNMKIAQFLPRVTFVNAMRHAHVLLGNSSAGVIEAPTLKLPAINVGLRQRGREHSNNIVFVDYDCASILDALHTAIHDEGFRHEVQNGVSPYGDGSAGKKIARILAETEIGSMLLDKECTV